VLLITFVCHCVDFVDVAEFCWLLLITLCAVKCMYDFLIVLVVVDYVVCSEMLLLDIFVDVVDFVDFDICCLLVIFVDFVDSSDFIGCC